MGFAAKTLAIGTVGAIIGIQGYMLAYGVPKSYHKIEKKLKKAANDLSDIVNSVSDTVRDV